MDEPSKSELPCPLCGEPLPPGATKCKNCGASVPKKTRDSLLLLMEGLKVDAQQAQRLFNLGYRKPEDLAGRKLEEVLEEEPRLFLCPECGAFVHEKDQKCSRCGAEFAGEAVEIEEYLLREERACPNCGEMIHVDAKTCPACGEPVAEVKGVSLGSTYMCPSCGVTVFEGQRQCEVCDAELSPTSLIASKALEIEARACPKCGGTLDPITGVCPYCMRPKEEAEGEAEEAIEEIDKFLEQLAATPATGGPKTVTEGEVLPEVEPTLEIEEIPEEPSEKAVPAEEEAAPEEGEVEVRGLPKIKLLKASYRRIPTKPPPVKVSPDSGRFAVIAEAMLYCTAIGLSLQYFASKTGIAILEWVLFLLFGAAMGLATGLVVLSSRDPRRDLLSSWQQIAGTVAIVAVPLHWYLGASLPLFVDAGFLAFGVALWMPAIVRYARKPRWIAPWLGGSAIAAIMTPASALTFNMGGDIVSSATWTAAAFLVLIGAAFSIEGRYMRWKFDATLRKGEEEFGRREFKKSVEDYDKAIEFATRSGQEDVATPWYSKGAALVVLGRYEEALNAIDEALKMNPNNEVAWVNKGNALSRMGDYKSALKAFNAALRANPRYEVAWNNKGNALARLGRYREGLKCYDLALQIDESYRGAWVNKGFVLAKLGEFEEAVRCAEKVMALGSGSTA